MPRPHNCGNCLYLHDGRCAFYGLDPKGRRWRYAEKPRRADHRACIHFDPRELPGCFHIGGVVPPIGPVAPPALPVDYAKASRQEIDAVVQASRLAADAHPYSVDQAHEIRGLLKEMGRATHATDAQIKSAFERIRRAADDARYSLQMQFWDSLDQTPVYELHKELQRVADAGVIGPRSRATLFDALLLALELTGLPTPPFQRVFDDDATHPQEAFIRAIPPEQLQRAAIALLRDERGCLPKRGRPDGSALLPFVTEIVSVFQALSGRAGAPFSRQSGNRNGAVKYPPGTPRGPLVDLIVVALQPVEARSRHSIGDMLEDSF